MSKKKYNTLQNTYRPMINNVVAWHGCFRIVDNMRAVTYRPGYTGVSDDSLRPIYHQVWNRYQTSLETLVYAIRQEYASVPVDSVRRDAIGKFFKTAGLWQPYLMFLMFEE